MVFEVDARSDEPLPGAVQVEFSKALHQEKGEADDDTLLNSTAFALSLVTITIQAQFNRSNSI